MHATQSMKVQPDYLVIRKDRPCSSKMLLQRVQRLLPCWIDSGMNGGGWKHRRVVAHDNMFASSLFGPCRMKWSKIVPLRNLAAVHCGVCSAKSCGNPLHGLQMQQPVSLRPLCDVF